MSNTNTNTEVTFTVPSVFFVAWIAMLTLGALHLDINSSIPHPGYWLTLLVTWFVGLVGRYVFRP